MRPKSPLLVSFVLPQRINIQFGPFHAGTRKFRKSWQFIFSTWHIEPVNQVSAKSAIVFRWTRSGGFEGQAACRSLEIFGHFMRSYWRDE
jgi:hypothetical protein